MLIVGVLYLLNERSLLADGGKAKMTLVDNSFSRGILGAQVRLLLGHVRRDDQG